LDQVPAWPALPSPSVLWAAGAVMATLLAVHLVATHGTFHLAESTKAQVAITPATTLSHAWRHLYAGFFHDGPVHIGYNLAVFAVAFAFATRQMSPGLTLANMYWIGPVTVFVLHLLVVLPLAKLGVSYAVDALDRPLVGFSVMAYSVAGAALTLAPLWVGGLAFAGLIAYELTLAAFGTGPFIWLYHLGGFALGYWVRILWLHTADGRIAV
jgi:hypothetical protein